MNRPGPRAPRTGADSTGRTRADAAARARRVRLARWYDLLVMPFEARARAVSRRLLVPGSGARVLEIGCATGASLVEIARAVGPSGRVVGIDLSPRMTARAAARLDRAGVGGWTRALAVDAPPLPFDDGAFDLVYVSFMLEAVRPEAARTELLRECHRTLAQDGRLVCAAVAARQPGGMRSRAARAALWFASFPDGAPVRATALATAAGFTVTTRLDLRTWGIPVEVIEVVP
jgi:ubiquinone/menaquinone biosynthesis C-methylase UbiE